MTSDKFNQIVKNRAQQRIKQKTAIFEAEIAAACVKLHKSLAANNGSRWFGGGVGSKVTAVFRHLMGMTQEPGKPVGYPQELFDDEEEQVTKELLATMDEMAKALMAPEDTDPVVIAQTDIPDTNKT